MDSWGPFLATVRLMSIAITGSLLLGIPAAWAISAIQNSHRWGAFAARGFVAAMVTALAIPLIIHAGAWESAAGKFGWLPLTQPATRAFGVSGLIACGWIHAMYGTAIMSLATWFGTNRVSKSVSENASLDARPMRIWWTVQLPLAWPWVLAAAIFNAALAASEMTVVDLYGYRTIADEFYLIYAVDPNLSAVVSTCVLPVTFAIATATVLLTRVQSPATGYRMNSSRDMEVEPIAKPAIVFAFIVLSIVGILVCFAPLLGLVMKVGHEVLVTDETVTAHWSFSHGMRELAAAPRTYASEYQWTLILGICSGLFSTMMAWPIAAFARTHLSCERVTDLMSVILFCIPGPIVGLLIVQSFQSPLPWIRYLYEGTILPLVLATSIRGIPIAYWILRSGYHGIDDTLFSSAAIDVRTLRRMLTMDLAMLKSALAVAFLASAIFASGDVPVTLSVAPPGIATVGTRLFGLLHSGARYQEASLMLWYLAVIVIATLFFFQTAYLFKMSYRRRFNAIYFDIERDSLGLFWTNTCLNRNLNFYQYGCWEFVFKNF